MSLNKRLDKNVSVSKFLDLIKEADDGGLLKSVEYVQLEQLLNENFSKNANLNKLINKLITDSTSFTMDELDRYNLILEQQQTSNEQQIISNQQSITEQIDEDWDLKIKELEQNLNLIKNQKELLESEVIKLYSEKIDEQLINERKKLDQLKIKLIELFNQFKPLLNKKDDLPKTKLDQQLLNRLNKLNDKNINIDEMIEFVLMYIDLNFSQDKIIKIVEKEYSNKLIKMKQILENIKTEIELIIKIQRNKLIKNTIWKKYLKQFKDEINQEDNLITCGDKFETKKPIDEPFNFNEFKEFLNIPKNDEFDELIFLVKNAIKKFN